MMLLASAGMTLLASTLLLHVFDMRVMALRYPLALSVGYAALMVCLWLWLRVDSRSSTSDDLERSAGQAINSIPMPRSSAACSNGDSMGLLDHGDASAAGGVDEAAIFLALLAMVAVIGASSLYVVWVAPTLLAELLVDGAASYGLYRAVKTRRTQSWLGTAFGHTILPFLATISVAFIGGIVIQAYSDADTIGQAMASISWFGSR